MRFKRQVYPIPVESRLLQGIDIYNNYGYYNKRVNEFEYAYMHVLGALFTAEPMYIYTYTALGTTIRGWGWSELMLLRQALPRKAISICALI